MLRIAAAPSRAHSLLDKRYLPILMILPALALMAAIVGYPIVYAVWLSFHNWTIGSSAVPFVGWANYQRMLGDSEFWQSLVNTVSFVVPAVALQFLLGLALALILHNRARTASVIRPIIMIPVFIIPVVVALMWRVIYNQPFGPLYYILKSLNLINPNSAFGLSDPSAAMLLIVLASVWEIMPFVFLVFLAGLQSIPPEQYEAARIDGASALQQFRYITLPWLKPLILFIILFRVMDSIKVFDLVIMLTNGGPGSSTEVASLYIYRQGFQYFDLSYASALSMILLLIILVFAIVLIRTMRIEKHV